VSRVQPRVLLDVALLALLAATVFVIVAAVQPVRPFVVFAAACLVPGGAILTRLRTGEGMTDLALAIGLSLAVEIAGSLALAWSGWWHPEALGIVLGAASMGLLVSDLLRSRRP
jgi:CHASE2 domain-containing sensor protein